jgi:hypothetical protein
MAVGEWFNTFCDNLRIPTEKRSSISTRYELITQRLNTEYRNLKNIKRGRFYLLTFNGQLTKG